MTTHSPSHHVDVSIGKPQQTKPRSSYLHDLGNGNFLDPALAKFSPASCGAVSASVLPYQEYHGTSENLPEPDEPRKRHRTAPVESNPHYGPFSWPEVPTLYNGTPANDNYPSVLHASSDDDDILFGDVVKPVSFPTISPLHIPDDTNWSLNSMLYYPAQLFEDNYHVCANEEPIASTPQVHPTLANFPTSTKVELHSYLSSPPFNHSFLYHPEILYQIGFAGLDDYATTPPTSQMTIKSPFLPWTIRLNQAHYITVYDILSAIFGLLQESPTEAELNILYSSSGSKKRYRKVVIAYKKRLAEANACQPPEVYFRKIDWLCGRHVFDGLGRQDDDDPWGPIWRLSFRSA